MNDRLFSLCTPCPEGFTFCREFRARDFRGTPFALFAPSPEAAREFLGQHLPRLAGVILIPGERISSEEVSPLVLQITVSPSIFPYLAEFSIHQLLQTDRRVSSEERSSFLALEKERLELNNQRASEEFGRFRASLLHEIEERRAAEQLLAEGEMLLRLIMSSTVEAIYGIDTEGLCTFANESCLKMLGYKHIGEVLGRNIHDLIHYCTPDGKPIPMSECRILKAFRDGREMSDVDEFFWRRDGSSFPVEYSSYPIRKDGAIVGAVVTWRDITERRRVEDSLKNNERRLTSLFNISQYEFTTEQDFLDHALQEVISLTESAIGYIYFYNEQKRQFILNTWSHNVMRECKVLEQQTTYDLDSTGIWGEAVRQRRPILLNEFGAHHPLKMGLPEGHVTLQRFLTIPVIVEGAVVAVVGVANKSSIYVDADIMQLNLFMDAVWKIVTRKRAEEERLKLEQQLLHAQKLESLGVLAGGIAHDFNNILMAIIGNADLALMRINKESPAVGNLHRIEEAAARAADLAKQMLAYSGKGKFVVENIDLNKLLEEMLHMLEVSISKKAVLRFNHHSPLPTVEADATQMRQIVMNLVINASEAIGDKSGVIAITTGCMDCDRGYLKDVWLDENLEGGLYVYLEIADSGCGMDKDTKDKLFDPFFTTKFTGRGLGMAAVLGIVRGHKGAIKVYSETGKGSTFKVLLPASGRPAELLSGESHKDDWRGSGTVLLVDDEETVRGIGVEMLQALGFSTITANDGREAVATFKNTPDISFVILDLTMPHVDGEQCFRELRQIKPDVKVIMSSGYNEQEVTQKFVGRGLAGFIQKPYRLSALKETIKGIL